MRWLADECIVAPLVELLRHVLYIGEQAAGLSDVNVMELAMHEQRLLLTEDKDFGDLVFRRGRAVPGSCWSVSHPKIFNCNAKD